MAEQPARETSSERAKKWVIPSKALGITCGLLLAAFGFYSYVFIDIENPINIILPFYYMEIPHSLFGVMMIGAEIPIKIILDKFQFLAGYIYKGFFYMLEDLSSIGFLCLRSDPFSIVVAVLLIITGVIDLFCFCSLKREEAQQENAGQQKPQAEERDQQAREPEIMMGVEN